MTLFNPSLTTLLFYSGNKLAEDSDKRPNLLLANTLGLQPQQGNTDAPLYQGKHSEEILVTLDSCNAHDTFIVRLNLCLPGERPDESWQDLHQVSAAILQDHCTAHPQSSPWSLSLLYSASPPARTNSKDLAAHHQQLETILGTHSHTGKPETTAFGWMWMMQDGLSEMDQDLKIWQRTLLLLVPEDRGQKVKKHFTDPLTHGFSRIELYTQKCAHLSRQYGSIRLQLNQAIISLQQEMITHLEYLDFRQIYREPEQLEQISQHLMRFLAQKATVEILRNSLNNNQTALQENLSRVKLDSPLYILEKEKIKRQIEQIESDLRNAQVVQDSTYALQDIQRAAEGSRFEHASYIMGATAALLAGIALFNGFLEIWSLALENTGWQMPPSGLRIGLSLIASIAIPLATTWGISRKKTRALLAVLISIAAISAMVVSTIWMNK